MRWAREHFAAFTSRAITFEEHRRRRLRAFLPQVNGAAGRPTPRAFTALCQRLDTAPGSAMFVGDDPAVDVAGARGAGLQAVLLNRDQVGQAPEGVTSIQSLTAQPATPTYVDRANGSGAAGCPT